MINSKERYQIKNLSPKGKYIYILTVSRGLGTYCKSWIEC